MADPPELWEDEPGEWLGGFLHPAWANGWRWFVAIVRWLGGHVSWPMMAFFPVGVLVSIGVRALSHVDTGRVLPVALSLVGLIGGMAGVLFGSMRFNRAEARSVIEQQQAVLVDLQHFNDELRDKLAAERK